MKPLALACVMGMCLVQQPVTAGELLRIECDLLGKEFVSVLTEEAALAAPVWKAEDESPPLPARRAIDAAGKAFENVWKAKNRIWKAHLTEATLVPLAGANVEGRWIWKVQYELWPRAGGFGGGVPSAELIVTMDGQAVTPDRIVRRKGRKVRTMSDVSRRPPGATTQTVASDLLLAAFAADGGDQKGADDDIRTQHSYLPRGAFQSVLTERILNAAPAWKAEDQNPPVAPRKAMAAADTVAKSLWDAAGNTDSKLVFKEVALMPIDLGSEVLGWYWEVRFEVRPRDGGEPDETHSLELIVPMDGNAIVPKRVEP